MKFIEIFLITTYPLVKLDQILKMKLKIVWMLQIQSTGTIFAFEIFVHQHQQIRMVQC